MHGTTAHRHYPAPSESAPITQRPYWGWSHRNQRMEFMDLPTYVDSFQQGYDAAFGDLMTRMQQLTAPAAATAAPAPPAPAPAQPVAGGPGRHEHGHREAWHHEGWHREHGRHGPERYWDRGCGCGCEEDRGRDCGCGHDRDCGGCDDGRCREHGWRGRHDCRCDCCIVDADIVVYARCGEIRAVPIEVANDSRKIRENVDVQVSDVRSSGGRVLPWKAVVRPAGPLTLQPCSTTRLELLVEVVCDDQRGDTGTSSGAASNETGSTASGAPSGTNTAEEPSVLATQSAEAPDVDRCEVGYTTIRLDGCLIRPIVVAIAVLPRVCDSYRTGCSCACCC